MVINDLGKSSRHSFGPQFNWPFYHTGCYQSLPAFWYLYSISPLIDRILWVLCSANNFFTVHILFFQLSYKWYISQIKSLSSVLTSHLSFTLIYPILFSKKQLPSPLYLICPKLNSSFSPTQGLFSFI